MKKIYYLLALSTLMFTACQKQPVIAPGPDPTLSLTLTDADYQKLGKSIYADSTFSFNSITDAKTYIPSILQAEYPQMRNGTKANVSFSLQIKLADSVYKDVTYTLAKSDYTTKYGDYSEAEVISWLSSDTTNIKFKTPAQNQLAVLTFTLYSNGVDGTVTQSFLYMNGIWQQIYMVSPAQYTSLNRGGEYNQFSGSDNVPAFIDALLKADPSVSATATAGKTMYVSFNYYNTTTGVTSQRVLNFEYNGTDWVTAASGTQAFLVSNDKWVADPTVYFTLTPGDTKLIAASNVAPASVLSNLASYGDFESAWTIAELDAAMILVLQYHFPSPTPNVNYKVTFNEYKDGGDVATTFTFEYVNGKWTSLQ